MQSVGWRSAIVHELHMTKPTKSSLLYITIWRNQIFGIVSSETRLICMFPTLTSDRGGGIQSLQDTLHRSVTLYQKNCLYRTLMADQTVVPYPHAFPWIWTHLCSFRLFFFRQYGVLILSFGVDMTAEIWLFLWWPSCVSDDTDHFKSQWMTNQTKLVTLFSIILKLYIF